jgi:hypothetical protein
VLTICSRLSGDLTIAREGYARAYSLSDVHGAEKFGVEEILFRILKNYDGFAGSISNQLG